MSKVHGKIPSSPRNSIKKLHGVQLFCHTVTMRVCGTGFKLLLNNFKSSSESQRAIHLSHYNIFLLMRMPLPPTEYFHQCVKGIRRVTLKRLVLLWTIYCQRHDGEVLIDLSNRGQQHDGKVLNRMKDVVSLFIEQEEMSQRTAYDYANAIQVIQNALS